MITTDTLFLEVNLGELKDILTPNSAFQFIITERAGNVLPIIEGHLSVPTDAGQLFINQGVELSITYGQTEDTAVETIWRFTGYRLTGNSLQFVGRLNLNYSKNRTVEVLNTNSVDAISDIASRYFDVEGTPTGFSDTMKWINPRSTELEFVNQIWLHSYKNDGLLIPAITADGRFILKDVLDIENIISFGNDLNSDIFSRSPTNELVDSSWKYDRIIGDQSVYENSQIDGSYDNISSDLNPMYGELFNKKFTNNPWSTGFLSDNIHDNYHKAKVSNISKLGSMASFTSNVSALELLRIDLLQHIDLRMTQFGGSDYMDLGSGTHFVKSKVTTMSNQNLSVNLQLTQDAMTVPDIQGDLV